MLELHTWPTPNGRKVSIAIEEMALPYAVFPVNISAGEQFAPEFLAIAPNNRIPAIRDRETGISMMESGAILLYLAEKTGRFIPNDPVGRASTIEWLNWQMGGLGPMLGQVHHFTHYNPEASAYARERYEKEALRLYGVLDRRLSEREFLAGDYSIADMAAWPWVSRFEWQGIDLNAFPAVKRWYLAIAARPAVQRGYDVPMKVNDIPLP